MPSPSPSPHTSHNNYCTVTVARRKARLSPAKNQSGPREVGEGRGYYYCLIFEVVTVRINRNFRVL